MGTLVCSALIGSLRIGLLDPAGANATFSDDALRGFLNEAERAACELRPEILTARAAIPMVAGTLQSIPAGGTAFMRLDHNAVSKRRPNLVDSDLLDAANRLWPLASADPDVYEYAADLRDRKRFIVSPPNDASGSVVALYGITPTPMATVNATINLDDVFEPVLLAFALHKAYEANTKRQDLTKSGAQFAKFKELLGINAQSTAALLPRVS